jgi:cytoskeletal protein CcmA (bactofilin family)
MGCGIASQPEAGYSSGKHHAQHMVDQGERVDMKPAEGSTVIGRSVTIHGELSGKEDLYMDGVVEGTISLPESRLTVGPNARVLADVDARDVVIYGLVEGNIRAAGRVELRESGIMRGDIVAGRLSIEENATIKGKVEVSETAAGVGQRAETSASAAAVSTQA